MPYTAVCSSCCPTSGAGRWMVCGRMWGTGRGRPSHWRAWRWLTSGPGDDWRPQAYWILAPATCCLTHGYHNPSCNMKFIEAAMPKCQCSNASAACGHGSLVSTFFLGRKICCHVHCLLAHACTTCSVVSPSCSHVLQSHAASLLLGLLLSSVPLPLSAPGASTRLSSPMELVAMLHIHLVFTHLVRGS